MRIDKFLKNARIIKRRTIAKEACDQGKVFINGNSAKPGDEVKAGDQVHINFGSNTMKFEILEVKDNVGKDAASSLYKIIE
ncbi:RNA-binding S4 domain-containing protein [Paratissierella segnis]|jgi:ribosomal 50S subunit-recycling heat shock protein|uniref:RQC P-site tRNA stabilizing factor n=1 Tax=Paratissierella segnis TaxID=2763679 RepID=A0A926EX97_9FIRM|nr:RNA-binding S4 domain-containing protein [Paratissierella segnis]MBC8587935.1 RNA-binding S4 domain-containing protein [Paratissierella segnis]